MGQFAFNDGSGWVPLLIASFLMCWRGCSGAAYQSLTQEVVIAEPPPTTVFSPDHQADVVSTHFGGRNSAKVDYSVNCSQFNTCTECAQNGACAWCKNLNKCVTEMHSRMTCTVAKKDMIGALKNSNIGGVFGPEDEFDHVGKVRSLFDTAVRCLVGTLFENIDAENHACSVCRVRRIRTLVATTYSM